MNELADFAFVLVAFLLLAVWKWPVVLVSFVGGWLRALFG